MMKRKYLLERIHNILRLVVYNKWIENIFYPRGVPRQINGETINIPFRFSNFYPSVYEMEKTDFIKQHCRPGNTTIDIGAHMGIFSFFLAKQVGPAGRVYSFEPSPLTFEVLQKTIRLNGLENIISARQQVMSNTHHDVTFYIHKGSSISNANSISVQNLKGGFAKPIKVRATILDDFMDDENFRDLSFMKIDAEGAELEILKGGITLIKKYRPYITLEVHPKSFDVPVRTQKEIFDLLTNLGYSICKGKKRMDVNEFCNFTDCFEVVLIPS